MPIATSPTIRSAGVSVTPTAPRPHPRWGLILWRLRLPNSMNHQHGSATLSTCRRGIHGEAAAGERPLPAKSTSSQPSNPIEAARNPGLPIPVRAGLPVNRRSACPADNAITTAIKPAARA